MGQLASALNWIAGLGIILGLPLYLAIRWRSVGALVQVPRPKHYLEDEEFIDACKALPDPCAAAESLIKRARDVYRGYIDSATALENKAATLLGFVGGGVSIVSLLAGSEKIVRPEVTPLLSDVRTFSTATAKPMMDAMIGREFIEAARKMIPVVTVKAKWLSMVYGCFVVGAIAITLNILLPLKAAHGPHSTSTVRCRAVGPELTCTLIQGEAR